MALRGPIAATELRPYAGVSASAGLRTTRYRRASTGFQDGVAVYHLSDKGLIGNIDVSGVKFSRDDDLNATG
jgi:hypothetical protein